MTGRSVRMGLRGRTALTFVELMIVVLVIGILSAVAAPRFHASLCHFRVEAAAKRITADINLVRHRARMLESNQQIVFDVQNNSYRADGDPDLDHPATEYVVELGATGYPAVLVGVSFWNGPVLTPGQRLFFNMHGCPMIGNPPDVPLIPVTLGRIGISSGAEQRAILIDPVTGKALVQ